MDRQNVVCLYNGILLSRWKEWSTDTNYNMAELWKHDAKKPDTKSHISYDSIYMKYPEQKNPQRQKVD